MFSSPIAVLRRCLNKKVGISYMSVEDVEHRSIVSVPFWMSILRDFFTRRAVSKTMSRKLKGNTS